MFNAYLFVFMTSFCCLFILHKFARKVGLVDKPDVRKHHQGKVPLVGGLSIFISIFIYFLTFLKFEELNWLYLSCATALIILGVLDDKYDISFKFRLFFQLAVSLVMIFVGDLHLYNLGYLMGGKVVLLPLWGSYLVTVLAVVGAINAFNMVDGLDGLLGGLASVTFGALGIMFLLEGDIELATFCGLFVTAMVPYLMCNLGLLLDNRFKVFMGDAGSNFIGFTVVWLLIEATQREHVNAIQPVTALWFVAVPLMDMATTIIRRVSKGLSPFKPDREHLHHICQRRGMSPHQTLCLICSLALLCAAVGFWSELTEVNEHVMFLAFLATFVGYFLTVSYVGRITTLMSQSYTEVQTYGN